MIRRPPRSTRTATPFPIPTFFRAMIDPPDQGKDCVLAWEAMPHALQGNLTRPQADWLDRHLARCDPCRGQFAQEQRLQRAWMLPASAPVDAEAGLQRLFARIDQPDSPA